ncbi:MAG: DUF1080 domain-containing protein [Flavobacteriales bacterium]|nr:DUF1080 domain-containing protein [Flavobacteriales bacterium]
MKYGIIFCAMLLAACGGAQKDEAPWVDLFDGKTLNGWSTKGGKATYEVVDGAIVGTSTLNTPNTFLCSDKMYTDFIFEVEYKVDPKLNSGIQIRSIIDPNYRKGIVHGYQIEIDPSERSWSAGVYDEKRRGWLNRLDENPKAREAFKQNEWNKYRVEAIGDTIKTWINGVPASYLIDDMDFVGNKTKGFFGLQVHRIRHDSIEGTQVMWKNIRIITENVGKYATETPLVPTYTENTLIHYEKRDGWKLLWDGKTTEGWRGGKLDKFPESGWEIKDGVLSVLASGGAESTAGGDIVTTEKYTNFELKLEFKITTGANSGIKYYVDTELNKGEGSSIGLEFQILDDDVHPDAKLGAYEGSRTVGSLYDLIRADTNKVVKAIGEWNTAYILSDSTHVEHWLNGKKVLEYERGSEDYRALVKGSKYKDWPSFGEGESGEILLQDHGDLVSFKNIKIRPIVKK